MNLYVFPARKYNCFNCYWILIRETSARELRVRFQWIEHVVDNGIGLMSLLAVRVDNVYQLSARAHTHKKTKKEINSHTVAINFDLPYASRIL